MKKQILLLLCLTLTLLSVVSCSKEPANLPADETQPAENVGEAAPETTDAASSDTASASENTAAAETTAPALTAPVVETGSDWPDNTFTKQIPKADFATVIGYTSSEADGFSVNLKDVDTDEVRAYIDAVKKLGFVNSPVAEDTQYGGFEVVSYEADNGEYFFKIGYTMNVATVTVAKK